MYDVNFFIRKFEAIPEKMWTTGVFLNKSKRCAAGHCGIEEEGDFENNSEAKELVKLLSSLSITNTETEYDHPLFETVAVINDGYAKEYPQPTPKQRILAALYDIKRMQEPEVKTVTKYVVVSETIRETAKEVVLS